MQRDVSQSDTLRSPWEVCEGVRDERLGLRPHFWSFLQTVDGE